MILTPAKTPDEYVTYLSGWQRAYVEALRGAVRATAPDLEERLKWGHIVYFYGGPVLLIRAEPSRVLFGFWCGLTGCSGCVRRLGGMLRFCQQGTSTPSSSQAASSRPINSSRRGSFMPGTPDGQRASAKRRLER